MRVVKLVFDDVGKAEARINVNHVFRFRRDRSVGPQAVLQRRNLQLKCNAFDWRIIQQSRLVLSQGIHPLCPLAQHFNLTGAL